MPQFLTDAWAAACAEAITAWPPPEVQASKLQDFWDWIAMVRPFVTGRIVLAVRDLPDPGPGHAERGGRHVDALVLDLHEGAVTAARVAERRDAEDEAVFVLAGAYADWQALLAGYDVGKTIMYRKLMLEKGDTLQFFLAAFFWTEMLAAIQSVPVDDLQASVSA